MTRKEGGWEGERERKREKERKALRLSTKILTVLAGTKT